MGMSTLIENIPVEKVKSSRIHEVDFDNLSFGNVFTDHMLVAEYKNGKWEHFDKNNKLPSNSIRMTHVSENGTVWLGTNKGICKCEYD